MDKMFRIYNEGTAAIQTNNDSIVIDHSGTDKLLRLSTSFAIKGVACDARHLIIWSENKLNVYRILETHIELLSELQLLHDVRCASLLRESIFIAHGNQLVVMSLAGVEQSVVEFTDIEGPPMLMSNINMNNNFVLITKHGILKVFDVSNETTNQPPKPRLCKNVQELGDILSVECNATSSLISILSRGAVTKLSVFNTLRDEIKLVQSDDSGSMLRHCWDTAEPRLLACDYNNNIMETKNVENKAIMFYVDEEEGEIYQHEIVPHHQLSCLIGVDVPYIVFADEKGKVLNQVMSDFIGLVDESPLTLAAMFDFSFFSRLGDIDKSFESLQAIRSPRVWTNLVPICIDMKRLDLTELCLSRAASSEGLKAMELAKKEPEVEVALAAAALQFGLFDKAKALYSECKRYDLLNQLLQNLGQWKDALNVADADDRIHLDLTKHHFARFLEKNGDFDLAADILGKYSRKSFKFQQLVRERRLDELECFVTQQNDTELYSWFGQFNESLGNHVKACDFYLLSGDDLKLVELHCSNGDFQEARRIVDEGGNAAAAHYLAKFYTGSEAAKLYCIGGMYNHAIRIAMANGLDSDLLEIAHNCKEEQVSACARYFEKKGSLSDACTLYFQAGQNSKALAMCLSLLEDDKDENGQMHGLLVSLVKAMDGKIPSNLSQKVFVRLQQAGEVELMFNVICSNSSDPEECLQFCSQNNIPLTEGIAKKLLSLCADDSEGEGSEKNHLHQIIAGICAEQGNYTIACKMYTMCGERKLALKCLVNEGDAQAVIKYATDSESKAVYSLAASYLQKMNTSHIDTIEKSITQFYTKAEKYDKLVGFLISQSQSYVEKSGQYEKALDYLKEALSISEKLNDTSAKEIKKLLGERISTMEWFLYAKETFSTMDRLSLENLCLDLLSPQSNQIIRAGDCYALLVKFFCASEQYQTANTYLQEMQGCDMDAYQYVEKSIVDKILKEVGCECLSDDEL